MSEPWNRTSVSQYKTYTDCPKKWFIEKIKGIRSPGSAATKFGGEFHEFLEKCANEREYPKTHENPVFNAIIAKNEAFFAWLITLRDREVEEEMNIILPVSKVPLLGFIDLSYTKNGNIVFVEDYKTCSSWRYTLTDQNLGDDIQMNIYGMYKKATFIAHLQFNKQTCSMRTVRVPFDRTKGIEAISKVDLAAIEMKELSTKDIDDVPKNTNSCGKYGGCPFRQYCKGNRTLEEVKDDMDNPFFKSDRPKDEVQNLTPEERLSELNKEIKFNSKAKDLKMNLKDKLAALRAKQTAQVEQTQAVMGTPETTTPTPTIEQKVAEVEDPAPVVEAEVVEEKPKKTRKPRAKKEVVPTLSAKPLCLVGCILHDQNTPTATDLLKDFTEQVLTKFKVSTLVAIPYNEGVKDLATIGGTLLDKLLEAPAFRLETKLPVDALIFSLIFQLGRESEFTIIRNVF